MNLQGVTEIPGYLSKLVGSLRVLQSASIALPFPESLFYLNYICKYYLFLVFVPEFLVWVAFSAAVLINAIMLVQSYSVLILVKSSVIKNSSASFDLKKSLNT